MQDFSYIPACHLKLKFVVMKRIIFQIYFLLACVSLVTSQTYSYRDNLYSEGFRLKSQDPGKISITFSIREFSLDDLEYRGEAMKTVRLADHFLPGDEGAPGLPGSARYIAIPQGSVPVLHIKYSRTEIYPDVEIAPAPRIPADIDDRPVEYKKDAAIYSKNEPYPAEPFRLSAVTKVRGVDAVLLGITPFQYNPVTKELTVYRDLEVEIGLSGGNGIYGEERLRSRWWDPVLDDIFLNAEVLPEVDYSARVTANTRATGCEYLIICPDGPDFIQWADTIKRFRTEQGILTRVVRISDVGGNNATAIETYVNEAYNTWDIPPAACLLLGDYGSNGLTAITSNLLNDHPDYYNPYVSDNPFADVNEDLLPDIAFSRITARNAEELELMVEKILNYERNPPVSESYYNHPITALGWQTERWFQICSEAVGGYFKNVKGKDPIRINEVYQGNPDQDPWSTATNTQAVLDVFGPGGLGYLPATPAELGAWEGGNAEEINTAVNSGTFLLQHRDHGNENGWGEPYYVRESISGLSNTDLTFVMSINCQTGKFNGGQECFAEKFHRFQANGHASGALGLIAPTEVSYSFVNDVFVWGMYDNMFPDFLPQFGTTPESRGMMPAFGNAAGKYFLYYSNWPYNTQHKEITFKLFHHHGDAFMCLYSEVPQPLTVVHDPSHLAGSTTFSITADEGALIALSVDGELIGVGTGTGTPTDIPISPQLPPYKIDVVVTKENHFRYHSRVQVIPPSGPFVVTDSYSIMDNSGNQDGRFDYGETANLDMNLKNLGSDNANNVSATISSADEYVTILQSTAVAGDIPAGQTSLVPGAFTIRAAENIPDGHYIQFLMEATDGDSIWRSTFKVLAHAPVLAYADYSVSDPAGNNNGRLDPGETAEVSVVLVNNGSSDTRNVVGSINTTDPLITIINDSAMFGNIAPNASVAATFPVSAVVITPPGHETDFSAFFSGDMGITAYGNYSMYIGLFPILILDLDGNANSGNRIKEELDELLVFSEYTREIPADLSQYRTLFLCLGTYSTNHVISQAEAQQFIEFLNNGGNLYMEGADTWYYDQVYNPTTLQPMFNIDGIQDGNGDLGRITGASGTMTDGMTYYYSSNADNYYIDRISPVSPAFSVLSNNDPDYDITVAYDAGNYKTIGSSFEFGGLMDNPNYTRKDLLVRYLNFFNMEPISEAPALPAGDSVVCANTGSSYYSVDSVPGATYYIWELEPPQAGTLVGWGREVTVNWNDAYLGTANLSVCGMNQTGYGPVSQDLVIKLSAFPTAVMTFTETAICQGDTTFANIMLTGERPWHLVISFGGYQVPMNSNKPNMDGIPISPSSDMEVRIVLLTDESGCETTGFTPTLIHVLAIPSKPSIPEGPAYVDVYSSQQSLYSTAGSDTASNYEWTLEPPGAGNVIPEENGAGCTIEWQSGFTGQAGLKVRGFNECGESEYSDILHISVANTFGVDEDGNLTGVTVYPNPAEKYLFIELNSLLQSGLRIDVFNASGMPVYSYSEGQVKGRIKYRIPLENFSQGMYMLKIETSDEISCRKVVVR